MKKRMAALLLGALLVFQLSVPPALAAEQVCFIAVGNQVQPLSDQTMPFWSGGYLYIPASVFTGAAGETLGKVRFEAYVEAEELAILSQEGDKILLFSLKENYTVDRNGNVTYPGALRRNGRIYVPASLVARYFDFSYSVMEVEHGQLVWLRRQGFGLTEQQFANAATYPMAQEYASYLRAKEEQAAGEPEAPTQQNPSFSGKSVYLCVEAGDNASMLLDALDRYTAQAAFFCSPSFIQEHGDLMRRMVATGQTVGILIDAAESGLSVEEQLSAGNRALEAATCGKTRQVYLKNADEKTAQAIRELGYRCLEPDLDRSAYELKSSSNAGALLQRISAQRGDEKTVWLGGTAAVAGLSTFLLRSQQAGNRCMALPETA